MTPPVLLLEEHCEAWPAWKEAGLRQCTCVHLDAHLDLSDADIPLPVLERMVRATTPDEVRSFRSDSRVPWGGFHAGNFLLPALLDGTVGHLVWVIPPWMPQSRSLVEWTRRELTHWYQVTLADHASLHEAGPCRVEGTLLGRPFTLCTWEGLPRLREPVLLDIDVDYFLARDDTLFTAPDILVEETLARLPQPACITVALSIRGGYTPLEQRHVGDLVARVARGETAHAQRQAAMLLRQGDTLRATDPSQALQTYQRGLDTGSYAASTHLKIALALQGLGRESEAARHAQEAAAQDPEYAPRALDRGLLHFRRKEPAPCIEWLRRAATEDPVSADLCLYMEGVVHLQHGSLAEGTACLERLLDSPRLRRGEQAWVHLLRGRALLLQQRTAEATRDLECAVALDGEIAAYHASLGTTLHRLGRLEEAARHLRRGISLAPQHVTALEAHRELVQIYRGTGQEMLAHAEQRRLGEKESILLPSRLVVPNPDHVGGVSC